LFRFGKHKTARFAGLGVTVLLGAILSQHVFADNIETPAGAEFGTYAAEELNLRISPPGSAVAAVPGNVNKIPGYPLSQEELGLVLDSSVSGQRFGRTSAGANFADEQDRQPFRARVVTWIKKRSSDFNMFSLFDADAGEPGLHVDVDTEEEEMMLQYQVGF